MKISLLIINLLAIVTIWGAVLFSDTVISRRLFDGVDSLRRSGVLDESKIKATFPEAEMGINRQIVDRIAPENERHYGRLIAIPATFFFGLNSVVLFIAKIREHQKKKHGA